MNSEEEEILREKVKAQLDKKIEKLSLELRIALIELTVWIVAFGCLLAVIL